MKKEKHLIALDLDGTLLTDSKEISDFTKKVIQQAIDDGHIVVIATGRAHRASIQYYHELKLTTPMVNFNGALTHHPTDKNWGSYHNPMSHQTALDVIDACYQLNVHNILAEVLDRAYLDRHDEKIIELFKNSPQTKGEFSPFTIGALAEKLQDDPTSLLISPRDEHIAELSNQLDGYVEFIEHRNWGAPLNIFEITRKGIHKAIGLQKIAHHYDIPQNRIIAFGDEENDLEMIDYAGVGVAMKNGINALKTLANHTTETNEQHGVGLFLESYLNLRIPTL